MLLLAAVVLTVLGLQAVGGWSGLQAKLPADMFSMVRPATDPDVPWPGMFVGVFVLGSFYWSMDQVLVQRAFAAKSLDEGRLGAIFCAFLKLATPFLLVLPGLVAKALYPDLGAGRPRVPEAARDADADGAPRAHGRRHRGGAHGPHQRDVQLGRDARDPRLLPALPARGRRRPGRCASAGSRSSPSSCWAPSGPRSSASSGRCGSTCRRVQAYLMMPMAGVFFVGVLWRRTNAAGVFACVATALVVSPVLIADAQQHFLPFLAHPLFQPWLHRAFVAFLVGMAALVLGSLATAPSAGGAARHDHARRHALAAEGPARGPRPGPAGLPPLARPGAGDHDGPLVRDALRRASGAPSRRLEGVSTG